MDNKDIASILHQIGVFLELSAENPFRANAYYKAARTIEKLDKPLSELIRTKEIYNLKGIGLGLAQVIQEIVDTGTCTYLEELKARVPEAALLFLKIPGLGPKKVSVLVNQLNIRSLDELAEACKENRLRDLRGFSEKAQEKILSSIQDLKKYLGKLLLPEAFLLYDEIKEFLSQKIGAGNFALIGELRRIREEISCLEFIIAPQMFENIRKSIDYTNFELVKADEGMLEYSVNNEFIVKFYNASIDGKNLIRFTGSEEFVEKLTETIELVSGISEKELFEKNNMQFILPELRESVEIIELAKQRKIPELVQESDIKGIFHVHSNYSDGANTLEEIVQYTFEKGFEYIVISDHSKSAYYANGLSEERVLAQLTEIDILRAKYEQKVHILKSIEVEILADGSLDYSDEFLKNFDMVIASVHSKFNMDEQEMTQRIIRAIENPHVTILGHPTGRLLLQREPYKVNIKKIIDAAAANGVIIEINCNPRRFDLDWRYHTYAVDKGVKLCLSPDAHRVEGIDDIYYGVLIARKGMLTKYDLLNCYSVGELDGLTPRIRLKDSS